MFNYSKDRVPGTAPVASLFLMRRKKYYDSNSIFIITGERRMPENPLAKKMKLTPGRRCAIINAPDGYLKELAPLPVGAEIAGKLSGKFDWIQLFVQSSAELEKRITKVVAALNPESILWISFPKGSSKIQTDLTRDKGWDSLKKLDLMWIT